MPGARKGPCANAASHRKAQAKYVSKNKSKHKAAVAKSYQKNKSKILASRKGKTARKSGGGGGGRTGRPRKC